MAELAAGTPVGDRVRVDRLLGAGAYAEVYRVRHEVLGWQAMKLFRRVASAEATADLLGEARLLSRLGHPNVVRLFDAGVLPVAGGVRGWFTMEYVPGGSLARLLRCHPAGLPAHLAVRAMEQIAAGLAVAHGQRPPVLHRDLTPDNVLVGYDRAGLRVRIGDFGLARCVDPVGQVASAQGTVAYLAPEVLRGDGYTVAGDVFSWGVLAYLLLTHHLPYAGTRSLRRFERAPLPPSAYHDEVGPGLDLLVLAALDPAPRGRPADGEALHAALTDERHRPDRPVAYAPTRAARSATTRERYAYRLWQRGVTL